MSATQENKEHDDRFPTGDWTGFYIQPDGNRRYPMSCHLQFSQGEITGGGDDIVGKFSIQGVYDVTTADCSWGKHYLGQHSVNYVGQISHRGIIGHWQIEGNPEAWTGPFFLWPSALGNLESDFERAFVEYELSRTFSLDGD